MSCLRVLGGPPAERRGAEREREDDAGADHRDIEREPRVEQISAVRTRAS